MAEMETHDCHYCEGTGVWDGETCNRSGGGLMASNESRDRKLTPLGWKWCGRCGETKKLGEFNPVTVKRACRTVRQPNNWCKSCLADIHKKKKKAEG